MATDESRIVQVLVAGRLDKPFDYRTDASMPVREGAIVRVPLGKREALGVVWSMKKAEIAAEKIKPVLAVADHLPPLSAAMRQFIEWAAWYNCAPLGTMLKMVLPVDDAIDAPGSRERLKEEDVAQAPKPTHLNLSGAQQEAADALSQAMHQGFSVSLIDGVTGSGKTEVYFDTIAKLMERPSGQVLVLLPEIALSVQWLERFERRFGVAPVIWHSGITPARRRVAWRAIASGTARVVVGARSALFLPYRDLQLLVVDEEHEHSYKQEDGVIYQARDMAVARARFEAIPVALVSATPSLESWVNAENGKYAKLHLPARHGAAELPSIHLIDMRNAPMERGAFVSAPLREALANNLLAGNQAMLFLNRRGYAPLMLCRACGERMQCPQCTSWLVMHRARPRLQCHHCGYQSAIPKECPACGAEDKLHPCGPGVEKIAEEVAEFMPEARVAVLSSDLTENVAEVGRIIEAVEAREIDILIGTQMVAKGHHFPHLALVGVVDADLGLAGGDLRAAERTYQLLHQLAGRAGRAQVAGHVYLQSFDPTHPVMKALASGERDKFMEMETTSRKQSHMPPFARLAAIILEGKNESAVRRVADELARAAPHFEGLRILGPAPAPLAQLRGLWRYRFLLVAEKSFNLQQVLADWQGRVKLPSTVKLKVDIDPYSFL